MNQVRWRVVKLGGSLLERPAVAADLHCWLAHQPPLRTLLVCGGGATVDVLRRWATLQEMPNPVSHELAIRLMSVNAAWLVTALPAAVLCTSLESCRQVTHADCPDRTVHVFDPWPALADDTWFGRGDVLPVGWDVTSDSIAARIAERIAADELVLLKSADYGPASEPVAWRQRAADEGYVDVYFPTASAKVARVRCVGLPTSEPTDTE
ncbi:MAG: hypothetical protein KDA63_13035 [Planctomycetales bacterium]|nr:hypothetical protein [Planctomycetales bacterium]